ncbi:FG-GAP-like repeat-containing protein [Amycolatopsis anabasis]|uniref:FG-GAP-like repeat-containing protein n=1 Tax=Amycolatopsis anabasis TaxID=1840409 RepID=UPI00131E0414|nr:FG-GAP-like repeat-containing protein [Amycolatopsis anabasis]
MIRKMGGLFLGVLAATLLCTAPAHAVAGGSPAPDGAHRFVAKIDMAGRSCSGALIDPQWVITTSSCFAENGQPVTAGPPKRPARVTVGRTVLSREDGHVLPAVYLAPRADRNLVLVWLGSAVNDVPPLRISDRAPAQGEVLRAAGFGRTKTEWVPDRLQTATFSVNAVKDTAFDIVGESPRDAALCQGDSGGPAFRELAGGGVELVGLHSASWQNGCLGSAETRQGATETRLDGIRDWLEEMLIGFAATPARKHAINLTWIPVWSRGDKTFRVYGSTSPDVPLTQANLLGTTANPWFTHGSLPARQTWYYRVVAVNAAGQDAKPSLVQRATVRVSTGTDFNGDAKDDVGSYFFGIGGQTIAYSTGSGFANAAAAAAKGKRVAAMSSWDELLSGDFNGDGKADLVSFSASDSKSVEVALSTGSGFAAETLWHGNFPTSYQYTAVGDFNGDGKDDIARFTRGDAGRVYVSLSDGTKFVQTDWQWHGHFALGEEIPAIGDFNGDGKDDIATFIRGGSGQVYVSLSNGSQFVEDGWLWRSGFALGESLPSTGDFDGDGKDDIVAFSWDSAAVVTVARSTGTSFEPGNSRWHSHFALGGEIPGTGDFDGDGRSDVVTFTRGDSADVYVSLSDGKRFVQDGWKWHDNFAGGGYPEPLPRAYR